MVTLTRRLARVERRLASGRHLPEQERDAPPMTPEVWAGVHGQLMDVWDGVTDGGQSSTTVAEWSQVMAQMSSAAEMVAAAREARRCARH